MNFIKKTLSQDFIKTIKIDRAGVINYKEKNERLNHPLYKKRPSLYKSPSILYNHGLTMLNTTCEEIRVSFLFVSELFCRIEIQVVLLSIINKQEMIFGQLLLSLFTHF